jgi:hypothetical protein
MNITLPGYRIYAEQGDLRLIQGRRRGSLGSIILRKARGHWT